MSLSNILPLFLAFSLGVFLILLFGLKAHEKDREPFSFLRYFPYELYGDSRGVYLLFARIGEGIALLAEASLPLLLFVKYGFSLAGSAPSYLIGMNVAIFLFALTYLFLTIIPASQEKAHLSLFFLSAAFSTLSFTMEGLFLVILIRGTSAKEGLYVAAGILFLLALLSILLPFHPKLKRWAELESVSEKDGTVSYRRPHLFILAFQEWLLSLFRAIGFLVALVAFLMVVA